MRDFNQIAVVGRLGADPKPFGEGDNAGCSFSMASNNSQKVDGEWKDVASWFNVTLRGQAAVFALANLEKGARVLVAGRISMRTYRKDDGTQNTSADIRANEITALDGKKKDDCPI